jgi:hypothetical protein
MAGLLLELDTKEDIEAQGTRSSLAKTSLVLRNRRSYDPQCILVWHAVHSVMRFKSAQDFFLPHESILTPLHFAPLEKENYGPGSAQGLEVRCDSRD